MPRPRHAVETPSRLPWVVGVAVVVGLVVAAFFLAPGLRDTLRSAPPPTAARSVSPSSQPSPTTTSATPSVDQVGVKALQRCRKRVAAGDRVLAAAKDGMRHWAEHVQAQTDADAGKITVAEMNATFRRTRLDGPDDAEEYDRATRALQHQKGSCATPDGVSGKTAKRLEACAERRRAQLPVLAAAKEGMADWKAHLQDMRRSARGQVSRPDLTWVRTWKAAPPHIKAYERAADHFEAPKC